MAASEVFNNISKHQVEGVMLHNELADYYDFLGLMGFKRMHEYRAMCEFANMRGIHRYYINHYNMLLSGGSVPHSSAIPVAWSSFTRQAVEPDAKREAVKSGIEKWVGWERETKRMYEKCYQELCSEGEIAAACKGKELVKDSDQELKCAERLHLDLKCVDYNLCVVEPMQHSMHEEYREKTDHIGVTIC